MRCFLCKNWAEGTRYKSINFEVECPVCGSYIISHPASMNFRGEEEYTPVEGAYKHASYIKRRTLLGEEPVFIVTANTLSDATQKTLKQLEEAFPKLVDAFYLSILNITLAANDEGRLALQTQDYPLLYCPSAGMGDRLNDLVSVGYIWGYYGALPCTITVTRVAYEYVEKWLSIEKEGRVRLVEMKQMRENYFMEVYDIVKGAQNIFVNMHEVGARLGLSKVDTNRIVEYLRGEDILKLMTLDGTIGITHKGIKAAERGSIEADVSSTVGSIVNNTINNINSPGSQIGINSIQSMQHHDALPLNELIEFVLKIKGVLPTLNLDVDEKEVLESDLRILEKQITNPNPDPVKVKSRFRSLMEGLGEKVTVTAIAGQFPTVMKWVKELFQ
ncbi:hypothetical protein [Paenibacillus whitsoniae]|uniref:Uncharacterized protein n=1 Tax=Paenibacillus whitsoniae TaxID=2496558 RepID=A0A430J4L5_9BACL|nr:hypothetical protein [Paenibacillus whitsoniae]RTE01746.1 hypothetical protein EJQ19_30775 [Paenibacillus whitsoniae]